MKSIPRHKRQGLTQRGSKIVLTEHRVKELKPVNVKLVQNTVHSYRKRWSHFGNSAHEPLVSKPFLKAAQVNEEQWELMPHINTPIKQSLILYYNSKQ